MRLAQSVGRIRYNKYGASRTVIDGITFPSKKEASRYCQLKLLQLAGRIRNLERQPRYELVVNAVKIGRYTGDFRYEEFDRGTWRLVVEDSKGYASRDYPLRVKLMRACHGITVRES